MRCTPIDLDRKYTNGVLAGVNVVEVEKNGSIAKNHQDFKNQIPI